MIRAMTGRRCSVADRGRTGAFADDARDLLLPSTDVHRDLATLYDRAPAWAQDVLCSAEGLRLRRERFSGGFAARLAAALQRGQWSDAQLAAYRLARLRTMLIHAGRHVPAMRERFAACGFVPERISHPDELEALPILDKHAFVELGHTARAQSIPRGEDREAIALQSSGTTGAGLRLLMSRGALQEQWAICWRFRHWHGIEPGTWCAQLTGRTIVPVDHHAPPYWRTNLAGRQLLLSSFHLAPATAESYLEAIATRGIPWIHGYPSMVSALADAAAASRVELGAVRWVTLASESVSPAQRARILAGFGVVPREHYAQTESVANFSECPLGQLHVDEDHAYVEFLPHGTTEDGRATHRVIGTSLDNWHQPFIRYDTGDIVTLADGPCACGRPGRIVAEIDGRREDVLVLHGGRVVGRTDHIFKSLEFVREAQIRQTKVGAVELHVVPRGPWTPAFETLLRDAAVARLGHDTEIEIRIRDRIERTKNGKLRLVVRTEEP
jgi:phenylacetate-CoA ligase